MKQTSGENETQMIMDALRRIVQALRSASSRYERTEGMTSAQVFILKTLRDHPDISVNELAAYTHTQQSTVSEAVARLEGRGLVDRRPTPEDRRRVQLSLTIAGKQAIASEIRTPQEELLAAISTLPEDQRRRLAEGLSALVIAAGMNGQTPKLFFEP